MNSRSALIVGRPAAVGYCFTGLWGRLSGSSRPLQKPRGPQQVGVSGNMCIPTLYEYLNVSFDFLRYDFNQTIINNFISVYKYPFWIKVYI